MLCVQLPYPSIDNLEEDLRSARIISQAYCGIHGELDAILQYVYHSFYFRRLKDEETANTLISIAVCEMKHFEILGETMLKLGIDPIYSKRPPIRGDYYSTMALNYSRTPMKMLIDDITGEMVAVSEYEKIVDRLDNELVGAVIKRIILDEQLHIKVLKERLQQIDKKP